MPTPPDPSNSLTKSEIDRLKRRNQRIARMKQGMLDLEAWLSDLIRTGIASVEGKDYAFWQDFSARMVDTQLSALGPRIRSLQLLPHSEAAWPEQMLQELAELYLLARGFRRLDELPQELQEQLLRIAGITDKRKDLLEQEGIDDQWGVLGQFEGVNIDNGYFRRTWLRGRYSRKMALLLDYNYQNRGYDREWEVGGIYRGKLIYYPAAYPQRALLKGPELEEENIRKMKGYGNTQGFLQDYAQVLSINPWLENFPCCLENMRPIYQQDQLFLVDQERYQLPTHVKPNQIWPIVALSGGHPITLFGEWTGTLFLPLSVLSKGRFVALV
ncbi:MAG: hypothetical protein AAF985_20355 [Bacteroidota bacterium]